jgi:hypothetical protein
MSVQSFSPTKQYPSFSGLINQKYVPLTKTTAAAVTYTYAEILQGLILRDPNGAARSDVLPTAALLVPQIEGVEVGSAIRFIMRNDADAAETITVVAGTGGTMKGTATVAQSNMKEFLLVVTAVGDTPTYDCYSLGTIVF